MKTQNLLLMSIALLLVAIVVLLSIVLIGKKPSDTVQSPAIPENTTVGPNEAATYNDTMTNSIGMKFKKIPAGSFMMGSPESEEGRNKNEGPVRKVTISKSFYMGIYEVTNAEYETIISSNPSCSKNDRSRPVVTVSWHDAMNFCEMMSAKDTEWEYRLPTEAEWEYCYRAGTKTAFYWGQEFDDSYCWYSQNSGDTTQPVGKKKPNAWGLYDIAGNVWEWCNDWYAEFYPTIDQTDTFGPLGGQYRILRGGSWGFDALGCRAAYRAWDAPASRDNCFGLRVVAVPKPIETAINNDTMINKIGMKFKKIPAGSFMMGSPESEEGRNKDEGLVRKVTISKPFFMGIYEVTQVEYETVTGNNPSNLKGDRNRPVEMISWYDAVAFCRKMSEKDTGFEYRLPTEAEWEYCYRAGTKTPYYWGQQMDDAYCWFSQNSGGSTQPVGKKKPNAWGLYDMAGNVWEWCNDWYAEFYPTIDQTDTFGPSGGQYRILRGGSWYFVAPRCRAAYRNWNAPSGRFYDVGLRVVASPRTRK